MGLSGNLIGNTTDLIPFDLVPSERDLLRYANIYNDFRIKWIKATWVPAVKGRPWKSIQAQGNGVTWNAPNPLMWVVRYPTPENEAMLVGDMHKLNDKSYAMQQGGYIHNQQLVQDNQLFIQKHHMYNQFSIAFKAKERHLSLQPFRNIAGALVSSDQQMKPVWSWKRFKWHKIIDPSHGYEGPQFVPAAGGTANEKLTAELRLPMWQPYVALQDKRDSPFGNGWFDIEGELPYPDCRDLALDGQWIIASKWEFKNKKPTNAEQFYRLNESGSVDSGNLASDIIS